MRKSRPKGVRIILFAPGYKHFMTKSSSLIRGESNSCTKGLQEGRGKSQLGAQMAGMKK
jgi:hypothetical protein